jgi:hypothetical protein
MAMNIGTVYGPCIALGQGEFAGHFGAGPKEHLVRRLSTKRWMRHLGVVLVDVEFHQRVNTRRRVQVSTGAIPSAISRLLHLHA